MYLPMLASAHVSGNAAQKESIYGEWRLVGWNDGGSWFEADTNYVSYRHLSIEIPKEGYVMAYSMVNEIFVGLLTLNGNEMIFDGESRCGRTKVYCDITENLFFEDHICDIMFYQLDGNLLRLYYTDNDYFVFASVINDSEGPTEGDETDDSDYLPFVELGKQLHVVRSDLESGSHFEHYMFMNEETVKGGKTYIQMYRSEDDLAVVYDTGLFREEDRKVYRFDSDRQEDFLMFDYSLKEGDTYETYSYDEQRMTSYKVISVSEYTEGPEVIRYSYDEKGDSVVKHHRYLRKWTVCRTDNESFQKIWIESVGSLEGPLGNLNDVVLPGMSKDYLAYVEYLDGDLYLPFSFYDSFGQIHGCDLPTFTSDHSENWHHQLTYELEDGRLHVYGKALTNCGPNNYAFFREEPTDDPLVRKLYFVIQEVEPIATCMVLHDTYFYVSGFDPNMSYIVVDNQGEEHPVINKTPQMAYRPFVEDAKVWKVGTVNAGNPVQWVEYYYFDGDTIIDGKNCKQMMCQRYVSPDFPEYAAVSQRAALSYVGAWYEEDKIVYAYDTANKQFRLMYDFSLDANDTVQINNQLYVVRERQTGGLNGFKGVYRDVLMFAGVESAYSTPWLGGVGGVYGPAINVLNQQLADPAWFLMACTVGDEVIYLNDDYEDGATPASARKRFDFTHTIKTRPKAPKKRVVSTSEPPSLYGEYNDSLLGIHLEPLDDAYMVRITSEAGKAVYEKAVNAGSIVALNIDISNYPEGCFTVTVENSQETFVGMFKVQTTDIVTILRPKMNSGNTYDLQGRRVSYPKKGVYIRDGRKVVIK